MRKILLYLISGGIFLSIKSCVFAQTTITTKPGDTSSAVIYGIPLKSLIGSENLDLASFQGKKILIVNTASECGFTYQYEGLEKLAKDYAGKLVVIGCPCNQFGGQEPGDSSEIQNFCTSKFSVTFPLSEKLDVRGKKQHPIYAWLTQKSMNGVLDAEVSWNFNKFLIDENGHLMAYFPSKVKPDDAQLLEMINR
jgi:glutathione peroxidase